MPSTFSWISTSHRERELAAQLVQMLSAQDTRDEVGVGRVRDALADLMFPGTTTLMTRARYFLLIPWIYRELERSEPAPDVGGRVTKREQAVLDALLRVTTDGVIGSQKGRVPTTPATAIYWTGLHRWGIRRFRERQAIYHYWLGLRRSQRHTAAEESDDEAIDAARLTWHGDLPRPPGGFPSGLNLALTADEATFLLGRIKASCADTLLAFLVDRRQPRSHPSFIWTHPGRQNFRAEHQRQVDHARRFSFAMNGAMLLYNVMCADLHDDERWKTAWHDKLRSWQAELLDEPELLGEWRLADFWPLVRRGGRHIDPLTERFVTSWVGRVVRDAGSDLVDNADAKRLIRSRERAVKPGRARLDGDSALRGWNGDIGSGAAPMDFRWRVARRLIADIRAGLEVGVAAS